jgi:hypothetical protein
MNIPSKASAKARAINVVLCVIVAVGLVAPAIATAVVQNDSRRGTSADSWTYQYDAASDTWTYVSLFASTSTLTETVGGVSNVVESSDAWVYFDQWGPWGYRWGWALVPEVDLTVDPQLTSARLTKTIALDLHGWSSSSAFPTGLVDLAFDVQWTGTGATHSYVGSDFWRDWGRHHSGNNGNHYGRSGYGRSGYGRSGYSGNNGNHYGQSGYGKSGYADSNGNHYGQSGYGKSGYGQSGYQGWGRPGGFSDYMYRYASAESWRMATVGGSIVDGINGKDYLDSAASNYAELWTYSSDTRIVGMRGEGADQAPGQIDAAVQALTKKAEAAAENAAAASEAAEKKADQTGKPSVTAPDSTKK